MLSFSLERAELYKQSLATGVPDLASGAWPQTDRLLVNRDKALDKVV